MIVCIWEIDSRFARKTIYNRISFLGFYSSCMTREYLLVVSQQERRRGKGGKKIVYHMMEIHRERARRNDTSSLFDYACPYYTILSLSLFFSFPSKRVILIRSSLLMIIYRYITVYISMKAEDIECLLFCSRWSSQWKFSIKVIDEEARYCQGFDCSPAIKNPLAFFSW